MDKSSFDDVENAVNMWAAAKQTLPQLWTKKGRLLRFRMSFCIVFQLPSGLSKSSNPAESTRFGSLSDKSAMIGGIGLSRTGDVYDKAHSDFSSSSRNSLIGRVRPALTSARLRLRNAIISDRSADATSF
jgi:hypothetical protein